MCTLLRSCYHIVVKLEKVQHKPNLATVRFQGKKHNFSVSLQLGEQLVNICREVHHFCLNYHHCILMETKARPKQLQGRKENTYCAWNISNHFQSNFCQPPGKTCNRWRNNSFPLTTTSV